VAGVLGGRCPVVVHGADDGARAATLHGLLVLQRRGAVAVFFHQSRCAAEQALDGLFVRAEQAQQVLSDGLPGEAFQQLTREVDVESLGYDVVSILPSRHLSCLAA